MQLTRNAYQHWSRLNVLKIRAIYSQKLTKESSSVFKLIFKQTKWISFVQLENWCWHLVSKIETMLNLSHLVSIFGTFWNKSHLLSKIETKVNLSHLVSKFETILNLSHLVSIIGTFWNKSHLLSKIETNVNLSHLVSIIGTSWACPHLVSIIWTFFFASEPSIVKSWNFSKCPQAHIHTSTQAHKHTP